MHKWNVWANLTNPANILKIIAMRLGVHVVRCPPYGLRVGKNPPNQQICLVPHGFYMYFCGFGQDFSNLYRVKLRLLGVFFFFYGYLPYPDPPCISIKLKNPSPNLFNHSLFLFFCVIFLLLSLVSGLLSLSVSRLLLFLVYVATPPPRTTNCYAAPTSTNHNPGFFFLSL
jgi:hypothetical protein